MGFARRSAMAALTVLVQQGLAPSSCMRAIILHEAILSGGHRGHGCCRQGQNGADGESDVVGALVECENALGHVVLRITSQLMESHPHSFAQWRGASQDLILDKISDNPSQKWSAAHSDNVASAGILSARLDASSKRPSASARVTPRLAGAGRRYRRLPAAMAFRQRYRRAGTDAPSTAAPVRRHPAWRRYCPTSRRGRSTRPAQGCAQECARCRGESSPSRRRR